MPETLETPQVDPYISSGVHFDIPAEEYHGLRLASASMLGHLNRSPAHARQAMDHPSAGTSDQLIGEALHLAVLQPDLLDLKFTVRDFDLRSNANKERFAELQQQYGDRILTVADMELVRSMAAAVHNHPTASALLKAVARTEVTMIFRDERSGVNCKARIDALGGGVLLDLKSAKDASVNGFRKSLVNFGYFRQAAFYMRACALCGVPAEQFIFLAIEKAAPFNVGLYRMTETALDAGQHDIDRLLKLWAECDGTNTWPGYCPRIIDLDLPAWADVALYTEE